MEYKYIKIEESIVQQPGAKTKKYSIINKDYGGIIGVIKWYGPWRKYSFFPAPNCIFETQCLKDITSFIEKLMNDRKLEKQNANHSKL